MNILCYGDSNTWGYMPNINGYSKNAIPRQYNKQDCWWYCLSKHNLYIDGLCGRCIVHENKWLQNRNASVTLGDDLKKYKNLDVVVIQLGTNDCKSEYNESAEKIAYNFVQLALKIKNLTNAQIVIISPSQIIENTAITKKYYQGANKKTVQLDKFLKQFSDDNGMLFISGIDLEVGEDGEHLTLNGHKQLGRKISKLFKSLEEDLSSFQSL